MQVKGSKLITLRFVSVVNYVIMNSKAEYESLKASLITKTEMVSQFVALSFNSFGDAVVEV